MNLDDNADTCDRCRYWEHHIDDQLGAYGFCRRHAPRAVTISKAADSKRAGRSRTKANGAGSISIPATS